MEEQTKVENLNAAFMPISQNSSAGTTSPDESSSSSPVARATGPRTLAGKERSKHNALKHGILSKALLLKSESRREFDCLWNGLRADRRPVGMLEEILVERLAVLTWRDSRFIAAETGAIRKNTEFLEWDEDCQQTESANQIIEACSEESASVFEDKGNGLIRHVTNPKILERCVELLRELHENIKTDGFAPDQDHEILNKLYGTNEHLHQTVKKEYAVWSATADCSEEERQQNGYASPEQCVANVLDAIEHETKRLISYNRARKQVDSAKTQIDKLRGSVPGLADMDRLIRYEATINREFDRTLNQLERAQRMRLGQPVLPPIKLDLSST